ncbi:MAG TPA: TolC family protein, partial [Terriglobales bacterium]|nr:TolC family protein [Terriglobales bacterium]
MKTASALVSVVLLLSGCAPYKYHAVPVSPAAIAAKFESRRLDDPELRAWMESAVQYHPSVWPQRSWDFRTLTFAAWYFSPDLDVARQQLSEAQAAIQTAAMKPNPSVGAESGYETAPEAPFLVTMHLDFPIETAGKRRYRVTAAKDLSFASHLQLDNTAWKVRDRLRTAWVSYCLAIRQRDLLRHQVLLQNQYTNLL